MTDDFAELVMPIFHNVIDLQGRLLRGESRSLDEVKRMTSGWIEEGRRRTLGGPKLKLSYELAMFGLVAWIDEILTDSDWGRRVGSPEEILEWDLFSSRDRASLFYDHADRAEGEGNMDALETYLLAVTLGFKGELVYDDSRLADWVHRVYGRVSEAATVPERPLRRGPAPGGTLRAVAGAVAVARGQRPGLDHGADHPGRLPPRRPGRIRRPASGLHGQPGERPSRGTSAHPHHPGLRRHFAA